METTLARQLKPISKPSAVTLPMTVIILAESSSCQSAKMLSLAIRSCQGHGAISHNKNRMNTKHSGIFVILFYPFI